MRPSCSSCRARAASSIGTGSRPASARRASNAVTAARRGRPAAGEVEPARLRFEAEQRDEGRRPRLVADERGRRQPGVELAHARLEHRVGAGARCRRASACEQIHRSTSTNPSAPCELRRRRGSAASGAASSRPGASTSAASRRRTSSRASSSRRRASSFRGGSGSSTRPPPTVVACRSTTRSPRAATSGLERRSCANRSPTRNEPRRHGRGSVADGHVRAAQLADPVELDVEAVRGRVAAGLDDRVAGLRAPAALGGDGERDALAGVGALDRLVVHLDAAHPELVVRPAAPRAGRRGRSSPSGASRSPPSRRRAG